MAYLYKKRGFWYVAYRTPQGWKRTSLQTTRRAEARASLPAYCLREEAPAAPPATQLDLRDFAEYYLQHRAQCVSHDSYVAHGEHAIRPFVRFLSDNGVQRLDEVTEHQVRAYLTARLATCSPATVKSNAFDIGQMFRTALCWGFLHSTPMANIKPLKAPDTQKSRALTEAEVDKLLEASRATAIHPLVATGIYAGLRKAELIHLEWADIDWEAGVINVRNKKGPNAFTTKNKQNRRIPIHTRLRPILASIQQPNGLCFVSSRGRPWDDANLLRAFRAVVRASGIDPTQVNLHALRHTFLTLLTSKTHNLPAAQRMAGHSQIQTTMRYVHVFDEVLKNEMAKWV